MRAISGSADNFIIPASVRVGGGDGIVFLNGGDGDFGEVFVRFGDAGTGYNSTPGIVSASDCQQRVQFPLQQGVYIINTDGAAGRSSTKIVVRKD